MRNPFRLPSALRQVARLVLGLVLAVSVARAIPVQEIPIQEISYNVRTWTTDDGLPHNSTSRLVQDHAGFMWVATLGGLTRFDGRQFKELKLPSVYQGRGLNIRSFAEESPGTFIVLSTSGRVLRLANGEFTEHPCSRAAQRMDDGPLDVYVEPGGVVWLGTYRGHLLRWSPDGESQIFPREPAVMQRLKRFSFATDGDGVTWITYDTFLARYEAGKLQYYPDPPTGPLILAPGRNGLIWVCTEHGLYQMEKGRLTLVTDAVPWLEDFSSVRHLCEDSLGRVWITNRRGLYRYAGGQFQRIPAPYSMISYVMEDREGSMWVATDGSGIGQLREKSSRMLNEDDGLGMDSVSAITEDREGRIWVANREGGIAEVTNELYDARRIDLSYPKLSVETILADHSGRLWFGGQQSGLWRASADALHSAEKLERPNSSLQVLFETRSGEVWFATTNGQLGRYRGNDVQIFTGSDGFDRQEISAIAEDAKGQLWLGGRRGQLVKWDGQRFRRDPSVKLSQMIHAIYADKAGALWIATAGGLVLKNDEVFHFTQANGLPDDIIHQIMEDDFGRMWLATRRGLFFIAKDDLLAASRNPAHRPASHFFGREQGLVGFASTDNYQPATLKSRNGLLWFATAQGALVIDPAKVSDSFPPPPLLIDEVRIDGSRVTPATVAPLQVGAGANRIEFRMAALSYIAPGSVAFRHRIDGLDRDWIDAGSDGLVSYTNLRPGSYLLRVMARNSFGPWSDKETTLAFTVIPAWWETLSFQILAVVVFASAVIALARLGFQRRLRARVVRLEQAHALDKERARIARDLHDDLGASLTEIGMLAERLVTTGPQEYNPQLSGLAWRTRQLSTELSSIVWTMSGKSSTLDRFAQFLSQYAERLFRHTPITCLASGAETIPSLAIAPDFQHHLLAAAKEALNNVIKHSNASEVVVRLRWTSETFEVTIADDGVGFVYGPEIDYEGNGLLNIKTRMEEIGAQLMVTSAPGEGTALHIQLRSAHIRGSAKGKR